MRLRDFLRGRPSSGQDKLLTEPPPLSERTRMEEHVVPLDDLILHEADGDCLCGPTPKFVEGGGLVVIHHSLDGREADEDGGEVS